MKRFLILLAVVLAVGIGTYAICYHRMMGSVAAVSAGGTIDELEWLKREFALEPAQYEKIAALHRAHQPVCADHCTRFLAANERLQQLLSEPRGWSPEIEAVLSERARIQSECNASMLKHAYEVAAQMSPGQGQRYLEMIKLQMLNGDPSGMFAAGH